MRAAIYTRVSTTRQSDEGYSMDEQERRCRKLIEDEYGKDAQIEMFVEAGVKGTLKSRPELDRLLARIDQLDVVVAYSLDRLGRSAKHMLELWDGFDAAGVTLVFVREKIDTSTPVGRLLRTVLVALAEFERDLIAERTSGALENRARKGGHSGGEAPFGYRWLEKELVELPAEAEVVRRVYREYSEGRSQREIVRTLNADGVPTRTGAKWQQSAITKMLRSVVYIGKVEHKRQVFDGSHPAIVDQATWEKAQKVRGRLSGTGGRKPAGKHLLTHGIFRCSCGAAMIPGRHGRESSANATSAGAGSRTPAPATSLRSGASSWMGRSSKHSSTGTSTTRPPASGSLNGGPTP